MMSITAEERANILVEALPYIKKFHGKTILVKYGGHAMVNEKLKEKVALDAVLMKYVGMNPVIVHGGGPEISVMLDKIGKKSEFVNGLRVTDAETMDIVEMVLVGKVNKSIVSSISKNGGKALGFSGKDGEIIEAIPQCDELGYVGNVKKINPSILKTVMQQGYIPVVAPVGVGPDGQSYNINADTVAGELAACLEVEKLMLLTDVKGIYRDIKDENTFIPTIKTSEVHKLIENNIIAGGMIPKLNCCVKALDGGVKSAHIIDGRTNHSPLLEVFTDQGVGTMVIKDSKEDYSE
jgi:acetylglutamate kinase